jgi:hypothetical protein
MLVFPNENGCVLQGIVFHQNKCVELAFRVVFIGEMPFHETNTLNCPLGLCTLGDGLSLGFS